MPNSAVKPLILVVEDDPAVRNLIVAALEAHGLRHMAVETAHAAIAAASSQAPSIVLLDLGLPDMDGVKVVESVRAWSGMPIIVVSARSEDADKIRALDAGADDYLTKPFDLDELQARIEVQRRHHAERARAGTAASTAKADGSSQLLAFRRWELDPDGRVFCVDGEEVALTRTEFNILELLMGRPQKVFTKQELFELAWGEPYSVEDSTVNVHVSNLRRKLKPTGTDSYLQTVWGMGYKLHNA